MRTISSFITAILLLTMTFTVKILDNPYLVFAVMAVCSIVGYILSKVKNRRSLADIGRGILYGSLASIFLTGGFLIWLSYNFPK